MEIQIPENLYNGYGLDAFLLHEALNNPAFTSQHLSLYFALKVIQNDAGWNELEIGRPRDYVMRIARISRRETYYPKLKDLEMWGMIRIIKISKNPAIATTISLVTEKLKAFLTSRSTRPRKKKDDRDVLKTGHVHVLNTGPVNSTIVKSMPDGIDDHNCGTEGEAHAPHPSARENSSESVPPMTAINDLEVYTPKNPYIQYGVYDVQNLKAYLHEKGVEGETVHNILRQSGKADVVTAVIYHCRLKESEVVTGIEMLIQYLRDNPSPAGDETVKALTLSPEEKQALEKQKP